MKAVSPSGSVTMRSGLALVAPSSEGDGAHVSLASALTALQQLDRTLCEIEQRFGEAQREWVMLEMEYAGSGAECAA